MGSEMCIRDRSEDASAALQTSALSNYAVTRDDAAPIETRFGQTALTPDAERQSMESATVLASQDAGKPASFSPGIRQAADDFGTEVNAGVRLNVQRAMDAKDDLIQGAQDAWESFKGNF